MSFFSRFGIENIIQAVINFSRVDVKYVKITEPSEDSFLFSLDAQVYRTGPVYATVSAMTVDLAGPSGIYGKLAMDEVRITPTETRVLIKDQKIKITNMENFLSLSKILVKEKSADFSLVNGVGTVKVLGFTFPIKFSKTCPVPGMAGPRTEYLRVSEGGNKIVAKIYNPSPLEMDMGNTVFECRDMKGVVLARQRGRVWITPGESEHEVSIDVVVGDDAGRPEPDGTLRMVGVDIDDDSNSWMRQGVQGYDVELPEAPQLIAFINRKRDEALKTDSDAAVLAEDKDDNGQTSMAEAQVS